MSFHLRFLTPSLAQRSVQSPHSVDMVFLSLQRWLLKSESTVEESIGKTHPVRQFYDVPASPEKANSLVLDPWLLSSCAYPVITLVFFCVELNS